MLYISLYEASEECPMKGTKGYIDLGTVFDEIFEAARNFQDEFRKNFNVHDACGSHRTDGPGTEGRKPDGSRPEGRSWFFNENTDYYPNYSYPPMNIFMTADRSMVFEFALAGFDEKDIHLSFQGDYMVFSAAMSETGETFNSSSQDNNIRYFKRRLKLKEIEKQKYFVPLDKYAQDKVKAVFRNGILRISVPPKEEPDQNEGIKIEIVSET